MIESRKKLCPSIVHRPSSSPAVIKATIGETGYSRSAVFSALVDLETVGLIRRRCATDKDQVRGDTWFGP